MGQTMADRIESARRRRFVGRTAELSRLEGMLRSPEPGVVFVSGPSGVGKSTLLRRFAERAAASGAAVTLLDARDIPPTADAMAFRLSRATAATTAGRPVVIVDTYELLTEVDAAFRNEIAPTLPADTLIVIGGQYPPGAGWRTDPGWSDLLVSMRLPNLGRRRLVRLPVRPRHPGRRARRRDRVHPRAPAGPRAGGGGAAGARVVRCGPVRRRHRGAARLAHPTHPDGRPPPGARGIGAGPVRHRAAAGGADRGARRRRPLRLAAVAAVRRIRPVRALPARPGPHGVVDRSALAASGAVRADARAGSGVLPVPAGQPGSRGAGRPVAGPDVPAHRSAQVPAATGSAGRFAPGSGGRGRPKRRGRAGAPARGDGVGLARPGLVGPPGRGLVGRPGRRWRRGRRGLPPRGRGCRPRSGGGCAEDGVPADPAVDAARLQLRAMPPVRPGGAGHPGPVLAHPRRRSIRLTRVRR